MRTSSIHGSLSWFWCFATTNSQPLREGCDMGHCQATTFAKEGLKKCAHSRKNPVDWICFHSKVVLEFYEIEMCESC